MSNAPEKIYIHDVDAEDKDIDPAQYDVTGMTLYIRADLVEIELAKAKDLVPSSETANKWLPISEAPRDKALIVYDEESGDMDIAIFDTRPVKDCWQSGGMVIHPTHWMPLPSAPHETPPKESE